MLITYRKEFSHAGSADDFGRLAISQLFSVAGCPGEEARLIAIHLVEADASGHPSHGIVRVPRYMDYIKQQKVRPVCAYTTLMSSGSLRLFDGQYSFGQVLGPVSYTHLTLPTNREV